MISVMCLIISAAALVAAYKMSRDLCVYDRKKRSQTQACFSRSSTGIMPRFEGIVWKEGDMIYIILSLLALTGAAMFLIKVFEYVFCKK